MTMPLHEKHLATLQCQIGRRPAGAPGVNDLISAVRAVQREAGALIVTVAEDAVETVERFAAAERECCPDIGWSVVAGPPVALRIEATAQQLDTLAEIFQPTAWTD